MRSASGRSASSAARRAASRAAAGLAGRRAAHRVARRPNNQPPSSGQRASPRRASSSPSARRCSSRSRRADPPSRPTCIEYCANSIAMPNSSRNTKIFHQRAAARGPRTTAPARRGRRSGSTLSFDSNRAAASRSTGTRHTTIASATSTHAERSTRRACSVHAHAGVPMTSAPGGGVNCTSASATGAIALAGSKSRRTVWPELVLEHHALELARHCRSRAALHGNPRRSRFGVHQHPVESVAPAGRRHGEQLARCCPRPTAGSAGVAVSALVAGLHRHLLEIAIVEPEVLAVGDHELRCSCRACRRREFPAETARAARSTSVPARFCTCAPVAVGDHLRELGAQRLEVARGSCRAESAPARAGDGAARASQLRQQCATTHRRVRHRSHHSLPGGAGASISRAPFGCSGPTTPAVLHASRAGARRGCSRS